jgi:hypothetical protein
MAQARRADRAISQAAIYSAAALISAIVLTAMVGTGTLNIFGVGSSSVAPDGANPALLQAGHDWEVQRRQQMGEVDPLVKYGQDWERQRRQQSGSSE